MITYKLIVCRALIGGNGCRLIWGGVGVFRAGIAHTNLGGFGKFYGSNIIGASNNGAEITDSKYHVMVLWIAVSSLPANKAILSQLKIQ